MNPNKFLPAFILALILFSPLIGCAQSEAVIHWLNNASQDAHTQLNATSNFITSFKATNDVTITLLTGSLNSIYNENFLPSGFNNNPGYLTNFSGQAANETGNGSLGQMPMLETSVAAIPVTLRFDFSVPLTAQDRILLADVDTGESYIIEAYRTNQAINLTSWPVHNYTGDTGQIPDSTWPVWLPTATNGTLTASTTANLVEPMVTLTPDQTVDRVILKKLPVGNGSLSIQFLTVPLPGALPTLQIQKFSTNLVISWPASSNTFSLYKTITLPASNGWTPVTNVPALITGKWLVTNTAPPSMSFYRLQLQ